MKLIIISLTCTLTIWVGPSAAIAAIADGFNALSAPLAAPQTERRKRGGERDTVRGVHGS